MAHMQKSMEEQYGKDVADLFEKVKNARDVKETEEILNEFIKQNWRDKEFHGKVGSATDLILREFRKGNLEIMSVAYAAVPELARTLSRLNDGLRSRIDKGRSKPGMEKMTADLYEEQNIKARKDQPKSGEEFAKEELLDKDDHLDNELKVRDAIPKLRQGRLTPINTKRVMKKLTWAYITAGEEEAVRLEGVMRSINANLASEYHELMGKLDSQESFRNLNVLK